MVESRFYISCLNWTTIQHSKPLPGHNRPIPWLFNLAINLRSLSSTASAVSITTPGIKEQRTPHNIQFHEKGLKCWFRQYVPRTRRAWKKVKTTQRPVHINNTSTALKVNIIARQHWIKFSRSKSFEKIYFACIFARTKWKIIMNTNSAAASSYSTERIVKCLPIFNEIPNHERFKRAKRETVIGMLKLKTFHVSSHRRNQFGIRGERDARLGKWMVGELSLFYAYYVNILQWW